METAMQLVVSRFGSELRTLRLPTPTCEVVPGVPWGQFEHALTPAFWVSRAWMEEPEIRSEGFMLGRTLVEEVTACILGGYGLPAEVGLAAYDRVRPHIGDLAAMKQEEAEHRLRGLLGRPLTIRGNRVRYRFPGQKSKHLSRTLGPAVHLDEDELSDLELRDALLALPGIGPKTASWIVRNRRASNEVAILDVHVIRAGRIMGLFSERDDVARSYQRMERSFLDFCRATPVAAAVMDATMWQTMRRLSPAALDFLLDPAGTLPA